MSELLSRRVSRKQVLAVAAGAAGVTAASVAGVATFANKNHSVRASGGGDDTSGDTPLQVFTAALIAEDLATTFYYNALTGPVIQDPNLAGVGGTATHPSKTHPSNAGNVDYLRAALNEEIQHANLLRTLVGGSSASGDPVQTFWMPVHAFEVLGDFLKLLNALESAFIGAYLAASEEFAQMAADTKAGVTTFHDSHGNAYTSGQLEYFAKVAASIMGIEAEHRVLGRVIGNMNPANQFNYEQTDGITSVYNGSSSAVAALTPFLSRQSPATHAYSLPIALAGAPAVILPTTGGIPAQ